MTHLPSTAPTPIRSRAEGALLQLIHPDGRPLPPLTEHVWREVLTLAHREQVSPLLFRSVDEGRAGSVPEEVRAELADAFRQAADRAEAALPQLTHVVQALAAEGVTCVALKGASLALLTYPDRALRPFTDLDVLVREKDRGEADRVLRRLGYVAARGHPHKGAQDYFDPSWRRLPVDIHWRYDAYPHRLGIDYAAVFAAAQAAGRPPVFHLSPADMVVALSTHLVKHLWFGDPKLRYLRDIAEVTRHHPVQWSRLAQAAQDAPPIRSPLRITLTAAAVLLGASVPPHVIDALQPRRGTRLDRQLLTRLEARILQRDSPLDALLQVAAMRWIDGEDYAGYARLVRAVGDRGLAILRRRSARLRDSLRQG